MTYIKSTFMEMQFSIWSELGLRTFICSVNQYFYTIRLELLGLRGCDAIQEGISKRRNDIADFLSFDIKW